MPRGVIPHPLHEVSFLMIEIPTLKPYICMIRVTRPIKCLIAQVPGCHTPGHEVKFLMIEIPTLKPYIFMIRVTRQIKCLIAQAPGVIPHPLPEVSFLMVEIPTLKPYIFMITKPNDFDLQLGCCISDAFSFFLLLHMIRMVLCVLVDSCYYNCRISNYYLFVTKCLWDWHKTCLKCCLLNPTKQMLLLWHKLKIEHGIHENRWFCNNFKDLHLKNSITNWNLIWLW